MHRFIALLLLSTLCAPAWALTVPLSQLSSSGQDSIYLPTIRSQQIVPLTRPETWQLAPSSKLILGFQHSHELKRSWLQVLVNGKVIRHIALTPQNAEGTQVDIPLPVQSLKAFNELAFRVEQHYTDKCEDPLDPSLWTQILPTTRVVLDYQEVAPQRELSRYPLPLFDGLRYGPQTVAVWGPHSALQPAARVVAGLAQLTAGKPFKTVWTEALTAQNTLVVATASELPANLSVPNLQGGQWVVNGQTLPPEAGVLALVPNPNNPKATVLVVSGNSPNGLLRAASALTVSPPPEFMGGAFAVVPAEWSAPSGLAQKPQLLDKEGRRFSELGYGVQAVEKINAAPIVYNVPAVGQYEKLWLDLAFSYSPGLNPRYSSLELRLNDRSLANIPLTNPQGETQKRVTLPIATELIQANNTLVAQFHLLPDKYGFCVDNYEDKALGKIHDDSALRPEGTVKIASPTLSHLAARAYPYSQSNDFSQVHLVVPESPSLDVRNLALAVSARLGRVTQPSAAGIALTVGAQADTGRHQFWLTSQTPDGAGLKLLDALGKQLNWAEGGTVTLQEVAPGAFAEQTQNGDKVTTRLLARDAAGYRALSHLFEDDTAFNQFQSQGSVARLSPGSGLLNLVNVPVAAAGWLPWLEQWPWTWILGAMVLGVIALFVLPWLFRRKGN
jgi:hypothetical protein